MKEFVDVLGDRPNQFEQAAARRRGHRRADLLDFQPGDADHRGGPAHEHQRRHPLPRRLARRQRLRADLQPDGRRRDRRDLRSQVWQWIRSPKGVLDDGRKVTADLVRALVPEELAKIKAGGFEAIRPGRADLRRR